MEAYELDPQNNSALLQLAESGPGFQVVNVSILGAAPKPFIALYARLLIDLGDYARFLSGNDAQNPLQGFVDLTDFAAHIFPRPTSIGSIPGIPTLVPGFPSPVAPWPVSPTLIRAIATTSPVALVRVSAMNPDPRISATGNLLPGTYLTTNLDLTHVTSGLATVGRYALPIPFPASHVYSCIVPGGETLHIGTVRPNFGQAGGGVEVLIAAIVGSVPATYLRPLPDWI
jgi:hypothetical protein